LIRIGGGCTPDEFNRNFKGMAGYIGFARWLQWRPAPDKRFGRGIGANMLVGGSFRTVELRSRFRSRLG
jgi:hypothetical protein